jgi:hypothetical protein
VNKLVAPIALAAAVVIAVSSGCGVPSEDAAGDQSPPQPEEIILRLSDVPTGYEIGDDSYCGELGTEGMSGELAELIGREVARGCRRQLEQHSTEISLIESTALIFASEDAAKSAMEELEGLVGWISGV